MKLKYTRKGFEMKRLFFLACAVLSVSVFAGSQVDEQIAKLEQEKNILRNQLIDQRAKEIKSDKRLDKIAKQILELNQELSEYLDTKPEIQKLSKRLSDVNRRLKELNEMKVQPRNANSNAGRK